MEDGLHLLGKMWLCGAPLSSCTVLLGPYSLYEPSINQPRTLQGPRTHRYAADLCHGLVGAGKFHMPLRLKYHKIAV